MFLNRNIFVHCTNRTPEGSPCFEVQTITYLTDNTPLEYNYGIFRGDFPNITIERFY